MDPRALVVHLEKPFTEYAGAEAPVQVLLAGLQWPTNYWAALAVDWLEQGAPMNAEVAAALDQAAKNADFEQRTRHRAFALARRWQRGQNAV